MFWPPKPNRRKRKCEAKALLESVRRHLESRQFDKALELLHKVEELAPADPEVQLLIGDANAGLEQNRRRELITQPRGSRFRWRDDSRTDSGRRSRSIQEAQAVMPAESALFRLSAQVDRRLKEFENRRLVEETYQKMPRPSPARGPGSGSQPRASGSPTMKSCCRSKPFSMTG